MDGLACRACGGADFAPVLSLGSMPLANALLDGPALDADEPTFPLDVVRCRRCTLVQLTLSVPPEQLFADYAYFSSFSDAWVAHAKRLAERLIVSRRLGPSHLVVEIASNDGYMLQHYIAAGVPVLGIEPASNIARVAESRGIRTISRFFGVDLATELRNQGLSADVIHANNVLAHVPDLGGVVDGFRGLLAADGVVVVEVPYVRDMIDHGEFDTIYHEHLCYFSLTALHRLFAARGLAIVRVERLPTHGGSLRLTAARKDAAAPVDGSVAAMLEDERAWGVADAARYEAFAGAATRIRGDLVELLDRLRAEGRTVAAYGAAAKGATLLNYAGIGREHIAFVVDRNTYKHDRFMPGAHIPILPVETLLARQPDFTVLLAWNFAEEIMEQQAEYRRRGGQFIVPVPQVTMR